jgi:hypothetical protein
MAHLTEWVLAHSRLVVGFWIFVTIAAFAAIGPAGDALSEQHWPARVLKVEASPVRHEPAAECRSTFVRGA